MKRSINTIFRNLSMYLLLISISAAFAMLITVEQNTSFSKVNNLQEQQRTISKLMNLERDDIEIAIIQFNGKSTQLHNEIAKLHELFKYDLTSQYLFSHVIEYTQDLATLSNLTDRFNQAGHDYYTEETKNDVENKEKLDAAYNVLYQHIDAMVLKNIKYNEQKFLLLERIAIISFVFILIVSLWYRRRLRQIHDDILHLYAIDQNKKDYTIFSEEVDAIALRMKRKPSATDNPAFMDPVTQINNHKGLLNAYSEKKNMKESNFVSVTVLEIDNFSKSNRAFSQEITQAILRKVAFTISLHEQATDVIARTDYNQFTVIFSRPTREQSYKDIDMIRQSISELKFKTQNKGVVNITVSGGFVVKPTNKHLDEAIKQSKQVLYHAQTNGQNRISQVRDLAESEL